MVVGTLATRTAPDVSSNSTRSVKVPRTWTPTRSEAMDRSCTAGGRVKSIALVATAGGAEGDAAQDERDRHDDGHRQRLAKPERRRGDADHGRREQAERGAIMRIALFTGQVRPQPTPSRCVARDPSAISQRGSITPRFSDSR